MSRRKPIPRFVADYHLDSVGRRRKLSRGAMEAIMNEFAAGKSSLELAASYGVSTTTIRSICYHVPRKKDIERLKQEGREA